MRVGDVCIIRKDQPICADMIVVNASGDVFISTGSLDGEKTLKVKSSVTELEPYFQTYDSIGKDLCFHAQNPTAAINHFEGYA